MESFSNAIKYLKEECEVDTACISEKIEGSTNEALIPFLKLQGYCENNQNPSFRNISIEMAKKIIVYICITNLAYNYKINEENEHLHNAINTFLKELNDDSIYLTNAVFDDVPDNIVRLRSWTPISQNTFDTGVIILSKNHIRFIWKTDED